MLASVSYLMEFFLAMDFLGCDSLRDSVERRILERITKSNCSEVLTFVENRGRLCLEKIAEAAQSQLEDKPVTDEQQGVAASNWLPLSLLEEARPGLMAAVTLMREREQLRDQTKRDRIWEMQGRFRNRHIAYLNILDNGFINVVQEE